MDLRRHALLDSTPGLFLRGYGWLPDRRRRLAAEAVPARVMGQRAVALCGPDAVGFFYDERNVRRHTAIPEPVQGTLFGHRAIHTLDGQEHRVRKAMFVALLNYPDGVTALVERTVAAWDDAAASWRGGPPVVVFDEASRVLTRAVCDWTGIPLAAGDVAGGDVAAGDVAGGDVGGVARDLVAMVDGFATFGPRHWRARRARGRRERWLADLIRDVRDGTATVPEDSAVRVVAEHREADGSLFDPELAAVELLNIIRPTVAVSWFVAYAAHALHRWPDLRTGLASGDPAYREAFTHELRRFYPFAPFVGGRAVRDLDWRGEPIPRGALVLLDLYGQNHDARLWTDPYTFRPERFLDHPPARDELVPQGGGDPRTGHRCPGELITVALLDALSVRLARLDYDVPPQDLSISLARIPARPASGFVLAAKAGRPAPVGTASHGIT